MSSTITLNEEHTALKEIASIFLEDIQPQFDSLGTCVYAAVLASQTLTEIGINHYRSHVDSYLFPADRIWPGSLTRKNLPRSRWVRCYSTSRTVDGYGMPGNNGTFRGHLIIETDNFLVDLSALQFDTPGHQVRTFGHLIVPLADLEEVEHGVWSVPIPLGRYLFCDAEQPVNPASLKDVEELFAPIIPECVRRVRQAMAGDVAGELVCAKS